MQTHTFLIPDSRLSTDLGAQLTQFGLNPRDWSVHPLSTAKGCAIHREDPDLILVGRIRWVQGQPRWSGLELLEDKGANLEKGHRHPKTSPVAQ